jgi:membrane associated rhomboid family serine protease
MNFDQLKYQFQSFYNRNKLLTYLIIGELVLVIILGGGFFEAIYNAYLVYFGGSIFKYYLDEKRMINVLIGGAIIGALTTYLIFPAFSPETIIKSGITAGSLALFVAAATYVPNMELLLFFLGKVKLKYIAIVFVGLDLLSISSVYPNDKVGHLGGVLFGFLLIMFVKNKNYTNTPNFLKWFTRPRGPYYKKPPKQKKQKAKTRRRTESDADYNARKNTEQAEIDAILDKIKHKGYESLSAAEKQKLFDKSKNG